MRVKNMAVKLNENEIRLSRFLARERYISNRKAGNLNRKAGPQSDYQTELEGVGGEIAFAKACNLYPDLKDAPGSYDMKIKGHTVDVKTTKYSNGHLEVKADKKQGDVAIYALVTGEMPSYTIRGWMCGDEIMQEPRLFLHKSGSAVYRASQHELKDFGE